MRRLHDRALRELYLLSQLKRCLRPRARRVHRRDRRVARHVARASGGTLFLDEIGELPLGLQPKLLRVLEEKEVLPVGAEKALKVDVRIVSATNRELAALMQRGELRMDLYARLSMREIRVPALRERRADILMWLRLLHQRWRGERAQGGTGRALTLSADAAEKLLLHEWPLNLRGLDRFVHEHGDRDAPIAAAELPAWITAGGDAPAPPGGSAAPARRLPAPSRDELAEVLRQHHGSVRATARHYGRDRRQIYRWLEAFGLKGSAKSDG